MAIRQITFITVAFIFFYSNLFCQNIERISFDSTKNKTDYYLAIRPVSKNITATVVLLTSFVPPERLLAETKLQNTTYANNILTVFVSMKQKLYADSFSVNRINSILTDIVKRFSVDTSKFALAGLDEAGNIACVILNLLMNIQVIFQFNPKPFLELIRLLICLVYGTGVKTKSKKIIGQVQ